jgi:hypothetical protein
VEPFLAVLRAGELHDDKGLKQRSERDEVRPVPIPPELVAHLRVHLDRYGTASDGRLFLQSNGNLVRTSTYTQVWRAARTLALVPPADRFANGRARLMTFGTPPCPSG